METKYFQPEAIEEAAQALKNGELVAFPTETVYGLGAIATNDAGVRQVYQAKGRPSDNPLIVHVADKDDVLPYVECIPEKVLTLMDTFWPGPLTIILPIKAGSLSPVVTGGLSTCAFRMPDKKITRQLIALTGPLVGPSANTSGKPSPTTAEHVYHDLHGKIAGILDGGETTVGVESTVIEIVDDQITILRPGAVTPMMLQEASDLPVEYDKHLIEESETPKAPGMKYKHYAPSVQVEIVYPDDFAKALEAHQNERVAVMASQELIDYYHIQTDYFILSQEHTSEEAATHLFAGLRALDDTEKYDVILAEGYEEEGLAVAYMNRLKKAANHNFFGK